MSPDLFRTQVTTTLFRIQIQCMRAFVCMCVSQEQSEHLKSSVKVDTFRASLQIIAKTIHTSKVSSTNQFFLNALSALINTKTHQWFADR